VEPEQAGPAQSKEPKPSRSRLHQFIRKTSALIASLIALIAAVATIIGFFDDSSSGPDTGAPQGRPGNSQPIPGLTTPIPTPWSIKFNPPINNSVPMCAAFEGTGDVPTGQTLWLMVFTPESRKYYPKPVTIIANEHKWTARNVVVGGRDDPPNTIYGIHATLVDSSLNSRLQESRSTGLTDLPGVKSAELSISRNGDQNEC